MVWGLGVFLPQQLELLQANSFQTAAYEVLSWNRTFRFVRECDQTQKGDRGEKGSLLYEFVDFSIEKSQRISECASVQMRLVLH